MVLSFEPGSLVVVGGIPGSGKSTLLERLHPDATVLSPESVAAGMPGVPLIDRRVTLELRSQARRALRDGRSVIIDAPAMFPHLRREYALEARNLGRAAHLVVLDTGPLRSRVGQLRRGHRILSPPTMRRYARLRSRLLADIHHHPERVAGDSGAPFSSVTVLSRRDGRRLQGIDFA
jgi:energy-coupling factor transporter ATP-binding protein EcfA2